MQSLQQGRQQERAPGRGGSGRFLKPIAALGLAVAMVMGMSTVAAQADEENLTPGPTVVADPNSPTGYTGHFVYYNPTATSVRFVADINCCVTGTTRRARPSTSRRSSDPGSCGAAAATTSR